MKNVAIINANPNVESFTTALAEKYKEGALDSGNKADIINLGELDFEPILKKGYKEVQELEPDLEEAWNIIKAADHLVFVYPIWWASYPALLKGFLDRVFLPGRVFKYTGKNKWDKYLEGKTARVIETMDGPDIYYSWIAKKPGDKAIKSTLSFCGVKPIKFTRFGGVRGASPEKRKEWLEGIKKLGSEIK